MKTVNQILEETFLHECQTGGFSAAHTAKGLAALRAQFGRKGDQPAPPHIVEMCEAFQRHATAEMEFIQFQVELERRAACN